jgi:GntR family transcriptional regulator
MRIRIVAGSNAAIYRQIADQVSRAVANGDLAVGDVLPSVRQLARELVVNPNTVAKAYNDLVQAGVVETHAGRGYYVAKRRQVYTKTERVRRLDETIHGLIGQAMSLDFSAEEVLERVQELLGKSFKTASESGAG